MSNTFERQEHRKNFPALANKHYLNFGAQGTIPISALGAISTAYDFVQESGPFSSRMFGWMVEQIERSKALLSDELGCSPNDLALTQNATEGCNIVLWGLDWQSGDTLLTTDSEHNGVMKAILQICKRQKLKLETCKLAALQNNSDILEAVAEAIKCKPRLFMLSHVLWNTGKVLPLKEIIELCHQQGIQVCADGAQSAFVLPLNLKELKVDYYAMTCHKWICGPEGTGALYVHPDSIELLEPTYTGWRGALFDTQGKPHAWAAGATRYEVASSAFPLLSGLCEAINVHRLAGDASARHNQILKNVQFLREKLQSIAGLNFLIEEAQSSLVSFSTEGISHAELVAQLELRKFITRTIPDPTCIRVSVHYFSHDDVQALPEVLAELISALKK